MVIFDEGAIQAAINSQATSSNLFLRKVKMAKVNWFTRLKLADGRPEIPGSGALWLILERVVLR